MESSMENQKPMRMGELVQLKSEPIKEGYTVQPLESECRVHYAGWKDSN